MQTKDLLVYEKQLYDQGFRLVAGVDEVGRGPLAGPVMAAAVILPKDVSQLEGVTDSKTLSAKKRALYYDRILEVALAVSVAEASVAEIDAVNILQATKLAMMRAIKNLDVKPDHLLIDHLTLEVNLPQLGIVKGDASSLSIAAASIVAKQTRDQRMQELHQHYPAYGFDKNAGYGTVAHRAALQDHGYIEGVHRQSFQPIKGMIAAKKQGSLL